MYRYRSPLVLVALLLFFVAALAPSMNFAQTGTVCFFETIPDLPCLPGMQEMPARSSTFDKPEGRIVEMGVRLNTVSAKEALDFYKQALPQLGWRARSEKLYERAGEALNLSFNEEAQSVLTFSIRPVNPAF